MKILIGLAAAAAAATTLSACASGPTLTTSLFGQADTAPKTGVPYYLPLARVPITITGTPGKPATTTPVAAVPKAPAAPPVPPAPAASTSTTTTTTTTTTTSSAAAPAPAAPQEPATTGKTTTPPPTVYGVAVAYGAAQYAPDGTHRFFLNITHNNWADDSTAITVDQTGLLQTATIQPTDQTGAIATQVVQIVGQFAELPTAFSAMRLEAPVPKPAPCALLPFTFTFLIDPSGAVPKLPKVTDGKADSDTTTQQITFEVKAERVGTAPSAAEKIAVENFYKPTAWEGMIFLAPVAYRLTVTGTPNENAKKAACGLNAQTIVYESYVAVPNGGTPFVVDTSRAPAVKKNVTYTIQNGMLLGVNSVHPSEYNGYASSVNSVLAAILAIPSNILTLHLQQLTSQGSISAAQATLYQNQINALTNQAALVAAKAAAATPPAP